MRLRNAQTLAMPDSKTGQSTRNDTVALTAVMVTYNSAPLLQRAFESLVRATQGMQVHLVVIDNASRDDSVAQIERHAPPHVLIRNHSNIGFARANNQALALVKGEYVLLLNPDSDLPADSLTKTTAFMEAHRECGILGVKLATPDGQLQPSCRYFPTPLNLFIRRLGLRWLFPTVRMMDDLSWPHDAVRKCDWVPGCFYLVRRALIDEIGLFDERYFLYCEEIDHCRRASKAGWDVVFFPDVTVVHLGGESAKSDAKVTSVGRQIQSLQVESELLYFRKNHGFAAVWLHAFLTTMAQLIVAVRRSVRPRRQRRSTQWADIALLWSTFWRTAWGSRPTR